MEKLRSERETQVNVVIKRLNGNRLGEKGVSGRKGCWYSLYTDPDLAVPKGFRSGSGSGSLGFRMPHWTKKYLKSSLIGICLTFYSLEL